MTKTLETDTDNRQLTGSGFPNHGNAKLEDFQTFPYFQTKNYTKSQQQRCNNSTEKKKDDNDFADWVDSSITII